MARYPSRNVTVLAHPAVGAAGAASILAATALADGVTTTVVPSAQPDVARNVSIVGNAAGINGVVVVHGTAVDGRTIQESLTANGTATVVGTKAFRRVTSIVLPARNAGGNTISVGRGSKLGLLHRLTRNTVFMAFLNNAKEGTAPTVVVDADEVEKNVATLNSALDGNGVAIYYVAG